MKLRVVTILAVTLGTLALPGCDEPRKERPYERITRVRLMHKVAPNWQEMRKDRDGKPELVIDLEVTNTAKERLRHVTLLLHVRSFDGKNRITQPVTLDLIGLVPGVPGRLEVVLPGIEVREGESVYLEMQGQPTREQMKLYPEYREGVS
jgi:hypothetical protein